MWGWPKRDIPKVNYRENSDSGSENSEDELFVSPRRPVVSRAGSPTVLAVPQLNDNVDEDLNEVSKTLKNIGHTELFRRKYSRDIKAEEVVEGVVIGDSTGAKVKAGNPALEDMPDDDVQVDFEVENGQDSDKAVEYTRTLKMEFAKEDVAFWFIQLENEMFTCGVKSQWLKRSVLVKNLPPKVQGDVKSLLTLKQSEAPTDLYKKIKDEILLIHAPKCEENFKKALSRVLTGLPSQLGQVLMSDVCDKPVKFEGCCCAKIVRALWTIQLPLQVRSHVADMEFNRNTFQSVFESADKVYLSTKATEMSAGVAAISAPQPESTPQVAAASVRGGQRQRGGRGGRGRGNRGGSGTQPRNPRPQVPSGCCDNHKKWAGDAWFCLEPLSCPLVNKCSAKPSTKPEEKK